MLTPLVSLEQGNSKKSEKSMKIVNIEGEKLLNSLSNFNEISGKMWLIIILKVTKSHSFTLFLENTFLEKHRGRVKLTPAFLGLKYIFLKSKFI